MDANDLQRLKNILTRIKESGKGSPEMIAELEKSIAEEKITDDLITAYQKEIVRTQMILDRQDEEIKKMKGHIALQEMQNTFGDLSLMMLLSVAGQFDKPN